MEEGLINFFIEKEILPFISKKGKIFFKGKGLKSLDNKEKQEIYKKLAEFIRSPEDCLNLRRKIINRMKENYNFLPIKNWVEEERPRELLIKKGEKSLSLAKLLAIILRTGKEGESAEDLAKKLLNHFGSLSAIDNATIDEISKIPGIGLAKACSLKAALELGKRLLIEKAENKKKLKSPQDVIDYVSEKIGPYLFNAKKEHFSVIFLDIKNKVIDTLELSKGSNNASIVDIKEIISEAIKRLANGVILVHNHPSGETEPSKEDISLTKKIIQACNICGIRVLDHIIVGRNKENYTSFLKLGLIR
ncbi:MAG: DNA repair protein RadC [candidate division WOR-3 bacterium]|uniref:JAB domain-containing protein n=1 Tax=candidate division WOR-3 bacterium TaxID=2052148 RepID=A0A7V4CGZ1_UNCW3